MDYPHCESTRISFLQRRTDLGYNCFKCKTCRRNYNERSGTPFNFIEVPTDIIFEVLLCRVRYKLSYRDVAEFYMLRGFEFTHETVRNWEEHFLPYFTEQIREKRRGKAGKVWFVDGPAGAFELPKLYGQQATAIACEDDEFWFQE